MGNSLAFRGGEASLSGGLMDAVQECRLIKQISQDIFESAFQANGLRGQNTGCDSSDCLLCQGQRTFCSKAVTDGVCSWLGKRLSGVNDGAAADAASRLSADSSDAGLSEQPPQRSKRPRQEQQLEAEDALHQQPAKQPCVQQAAASSAQGGSPAPKPEQPHSTQRCSSWTLGSGTPWQWREEFAGRELPAPSRFVEVASLQQPSGAAGATSCRRDMICGLDFSTDGALLAAAGVNKQVALYPVAALQQPGVPAAAADDDDDDKVDDGRNEQRKQQTGDAVPCLPPVALVRLPGKVSSIAWSPDMEGVLSIGDYDGTLTQVHVASGHYVCEIDAHAGRRIWSITHSRLRPHLFATASDDHTAKLWAGHSPAAPAATITLPGQPAVCCADFCPWDDQLLALAAADHRTYLYDLRRLAAPLAILGSHHQRAVSYAKFFRPGQLISASIDGTLAAWELPAALAGASVRPAVATAAAGGGTSCYSSSSCSSWAGQSAGRACCSCGCSGTLPQQQQQSAAASTLQASGSASLDSLMSHSHQQQQWPVPVPAFGSSDGSGSGVLQPWKVFKGHRNERNFVGLALQPSAGLMAVGSESSEVCAYHTSWSSPLARFCMAEQMSQPTAMTWQQQQQQQQQQRSVCAVAWQPVPAGCSAAALLAAASSSGDCKLLMLQQP